jgi:2-hydroxychromene-2-carboxylate isomerase
MGRRPARSEATLVDMKIPFYFDYACPWAFLGSSRVEAYLKDLDVEVDFRPVDLAALKEPAAGAAPEMGPRKQRNYMNDLRHWCELAGVEIHPDARKLLRSSTRLALKAALVARDAGRFTSFHHPAYRARWSQGRDLSDRGLVRELLAGAGLDADAALERAESDELEARLVAQTQDAIARGVFGVPTAFVGDEMMWGNDRLELVRFYAQRAAR